MQYCSIDYRILSQIKRIISLVFKDLAHLYVEGILRTMFFLPKKREKVEQGQEDEMRQSERVFIIPRRLILIANLCAYFRPYCGSDFFTCYVVIRPGVISKMDLSTLQYFTFALQSKPNTKMLHQRDLNHPLMAPKVWDQASAKL